MTDQDVSESDNFATVRQKVAAMRIAPWSPSDADYCDVLDQILDVIEPLVAKNHPNWSTILGRVVDPSEIRPI